MSEVPQYIADARSLVRVEGPVQEWVTIVVLHTDYLATLERVRVETLREVKTAVMHLPVVGRLVGTDSTLAAVHVLAAIDRLINAATKGATDD